METDGHYILASGGRKAMSDMTDHEADAYEDWEKTREENENLRAELKEAKETLSTKLSVAYQEGVKKAEAENAELNEDVNFIENERAELAIRLAIAADREKNLVEAIESSDPLRIRKALSASLSRDPDAKKWRDRVRAEGMLLAIEEIEDETGEGMEELAEMVESIKWNIRNAATRLTKGTEGE